MSSEENSHPREGKRTGSTRCSGRQHPAKYQYTGFIICPENQDPGSEQPCQCGFIFKCLIPTVLPTFFGFLRTVTTHHKESCHLLCICYNQKSILSALHILFHLVLIIPLYSSTIFPWCIHEETGTEGEETCPQSEVFKQWSQDSEPCHRLSTRSSPVWDTLGDRRARAHDPATEKCEPQGVIPMVVRILKT